MTNISDITTFQLLNQHHKNVEASLARRLNAAKAAQNTQLVALLERERQQIGQEVDRDRAFSLRQQLISVWQDVVSLVTGDPSLKVWQTLDPMGDRWWCAYDPRSGQSVYAESETEMRHWIEQNYHSEAR